MCMCRATNQRHPPIHPSVFHTNSAGSSEDIVTAMTLEAGER